VPKKVFFPKIWPFFSKKKYCKRIIIFKVFYFFHFGNFLHQNKLKKLKKIASPKKQRQTSNGI
jgi:hypothetical protein